MPLGGGWEGDWIPSPGYIRKHEQNIAMKKILTITLLFQLAFSAFAQYQTATNS